MIQIALEFIDVEDVEDDESFEGLWTNSSLLGGLHTLHPICWISYSTGEVDKVSIL